MNLAHRHRIKTVNRGPFLPKAFQWVCSCGAQTPAASKELATLAQADHIREHRLEEG